MNTSFSNLKSWVDNNTTEKPIGYQGWFTQEKLYSLDQVKSHNRPEDGWAVDFKSGHIYNITPLFDQSIFGHPHINSPQMRESLMKRLGGEMDISFDKRMHDPKAQQMWMAMKIGKLN